MKIEVTREPSANGCTIGTMTLDGVFECYTLEDVVREEKIFGETAIPAGTYTVVVSYSPRFKRDLPLLVSVPGFEGVRIHIGNTAADTHGCILVGRTHNADSVGASTLAFNSLYAKILDAWSRHAPIEITLK